MNYKTVPFVLCDVFTNKQFQGNPLAVITEADSLTAVEMQNIATEFNFSESTFVLRSDTEASHRLRIFTPTHEVPFAGHPNVGTAHVLATTMSSFPLTFRFLEDAGLVDVLVSRNENGHFCEIKAPQLLSIGATVKTHEISVALGLSLEDIDEAVHKPIIGSVGLPFILVNVSSRQALSSVEVNLGGFKHIARTYPCCDILVYWIDSDGTIHTRVFAPLDNVLEDPATGSANGALVALLVKMDANLKNKTRFIVHQGDDMGRPCRLFLRVVKKSEDEKDVFIGGYSRTVGSGELRVEIVD